ncbi:MAG: M48 family metallopeptidase [Clostridia bacterium]|nr:M48 family metallopeptidase [Clostridia bacterium]
MNYELIRSDRKTLSLEITKESKIIIRAPKKCTQKTIEDFIRKNTDWINRTLRKTEERRRIAEKYKIADADRAEYINKAKSYLPERLKYWSNLTGLVPSYVRITSAEKRYGSCNSKNGICFSYRIIAYPEKAIDYVILHELVHIKHKNHSKDFYKLIEKYMPDYKQQEKILRHKGE